MVQNSELKLRINSLMDQFKILDKLEYDGNMKTEEIIKYLIAIQKLKEMLKLSTNIILEKLY
jgi:hypothetical protein